MIRIADIIKNLFPRKMEREAANVEELRTAFKERYHQFKLLLNANNKALEIMTEMEEAFKGTVPFGMTFVRSNCTTISINVLQIVKHLNELAPGKYEALYTRFNEIQEEINPFIFPKSTPKENPLVMPLHEVDKDLADQVGSKIANLGEIKNRIRIKVPNGFVVTAEGYHRFIEYNDLQSEIDRLIQATNIERLDQLYSLSASIQQLIIRAHLPQNLEQAILEHYRLLEEDEGEGITLAMRSSALGEDFAKTSFAGQYRSELNVSSENIISAYKEIVASKYGFQAITYRLNRGIRDENVAMCVGCLRMVDAVSGGVLYSRSPVDIRDSSIVINAVWGLPKSVVEGSMNPDLFILSRGGSPIIQKKEISHKERKLVCYPDEGVYRVTLTEDESQEASLSDSQAVGLARLAVKLEEYYGVPQDIEWAIGKEGSIIILQCRPLQQMEMSEEEGSKKGIEIAAGPVLLQGGVTASPGVGAGPVFIVKKDMDVLRFPKGAVLLTAQSLPRWATLLDRAAAVITEQGSIAGHLANVAREFQVPAFFGVNGAIDRLKDEQIVTVDADGQRIYEGRIDDLLQHGEKPKNLMEGSPVFETLKEVSQLVIPLSLLDPDSPTFSPGNCKTLHDITRFCHEKSVHEMFQFGKDHRFPERSSKQLVCEMPMQWWVLNLDDGFREEVEGKYVPLENIVSIPMLALWEGITRIPWEGPPAVDGRGFISVMFEATRNPDLVTGLRSRYANRNYFMISKHYCSLNSRFGFHFSTAETLVSDRSGENYISFQFKGGAADSQRRYRRILFIAHILEENGFRIELKEDHLLARLENHEKDIMLKNLKIIGYLSIHTRQLDMIMSNDDSVNYYRSKIRKDINEVTNSRLG
ncbi:MAG: pyruvate, water dikinase [Desulfobacteraceae bacterium]|nr:pyruvate, water dikinase [Desulfobacteraceae bacterium]